MADKSLPDRDLPEQPAVPATKLDDERRAFLRRAALVGLPVVLATVRGRTVFAGGQSASCAGSFRASKKCT
jgi:hypothetical protein